MKWPPAGWRGEGLMFELNDLESWLRSNPLPPEGVKYLQDVAASQPQRAVSTRVARNVASYYPSHLMGQTIQSESWTGERSLLIELEYNSEVIAFWDQPRSVLIEGTRRDGKTYRTHYTSDFLALAKDRAIAYEVKPRQALEKLTNERPADWLKDGKGYTYGPARRAYEKLGISHAVVSADELCQVRAENLALILRVRRAESLPLPRNWNRKIAKIFDQCDIIRLQELLSRLGCRDISPVIALIDQGSLFTRLDRFRLADPESAWIANSIKAASLLDHVPLCVGGAPDERTAGSLAPTSEAVSRIAGRLRALEGQGGHSVSRTTIWRYKKMLREGNNSPLALNPRYERCGRRGSRLDSRHESLIAALVGRIYCQKNGPSLSAIYSMYVGCFQRRAERHRLGFDGRPVCLATFASRLVQLDQESVARRRGGSRAAHAIAAPTDPKLRALRPLRPFERAHVDHWYCDLYCVVRRSGQKSYAQRAYVTFLIDSATGYLLALTLSFEPPSRRACSRVLRECVRQHGCLPEVILTDSGAEFRSNFFHEVLAAMALELARRPVGAARWGQEVERAFGIFKTSVLSGLPGYLASTKNDRSVSRSFRSDQDAGIELIDLIRYLDRFRVEWFNAFPRGTNETAPAVLLKEGLEQCSVSGNRIALDQAFLISTAVPLLRNDYKIDHARGLRVQGRHYAASGALWTGQVTEVRVDPEDLSVIYVYTDGHWISMRSGSAQDHALKNPEQRLASALRYAEPSEAIREVCVDRLAERGHLLLEARAEVHSSREKDHGEVVQARFESADLSEYLDRPRPPRSATLSVRDE